MGKVGKVIAGGILIVGGILIGTIGGQPAIGFAIAGQGAGIVYGALTDDGGLNERQGAILENRADARLGLPVIYGKTRVGPILADARVDTSSQNNK
ncbi:hypothetical protein LCGC14_2998750, partial [marine sediment metagenome]